MKKFDYVRIVVSLITVFIIFQAMPVHFFADNAENLFVAKHLVDQPTKVFSPFLYLDPKINSLHVSYQYRPMEKIYWMLGYRLTGLNPISYNIFSSLLFLILVLSIYNITNLLSQSRLSAFLAASFFLLIPINYKLIHWLGSPTLIHSSFTTFAFYFLFYAVKKHSKKHFLIGLILCVFAFLEYYLSLCLVPSVFVIALFLFNKQDYQDKKKYFIGVAYLLFIAAVIGVFNIIASKDLAKVCYSLYMLERIRVSYAINNFVHYYRILCQSSYPYILLCSLILFFIKPRRIYFIPLLWFFIYMSGFLVMFCVSSRYFAGASVPLSIFLGITLGDSLKWKNKFLILVGIILIGIGVFLDFGKIQNNIKEIHNTFELAQISYLKVGKELTRLYSLPKDSTAYFDNDASKLFYSLILRTADRQDIKTETVKPDYKVDPSFLFEGETFIFVKDDVFQIGDKLGDWRF